MHWVRGSQSVELSMILAYSVGAMFMASIVSIAQSQLWLRPSIWTYPHIVGTKWIMKLGGLKYVIP
jgi:hypothetical protein